MQMNCRVKGEARRPDKAKVNNFLYKISPSCPESSLNLNSELISMLGGKQKFIYTKHMTKNLMALLARHITLVPFAVSSCFPFSVIQFHLHRDDEIELLLHKIIWQERMKFNCFCCINSLFSLFPSFG